VLAQEVGSRLLERVDFIHRVPDTVLDLGCATGRLSQALSKKFPPAGIIALDWAFDMLLKTGKGGAFPRGLLKLCADMHSLPLAGCSIDLLFSNLALSWSRDLPVLFRELRRVMRPGSMLAFSCFGPDTLNELKQAWRAVDDFPHVHEQPDMHDIGDELMKAGFREPVMDAERLTLEYPDVLSMMRDIKGSGAHNAARGRAAGLTARTEFGRVLDAFEKFQHDGVYPATFEIIYGAAFAPEEGQPVRTRQGDITTFSIDSLKATSGRGKQK